MKKALVALTTIAGCSIAAAQAPSTVSLFGIVDLNVSRYSMNGVSKTIISHSGDRPSMLGFRGTEDLGGGLYAGFWLEGALSPDVGGGGPGGALSFDRRSTVGVGGAWGELRFGRENSPSFWNHIVFDPFLGVGPAAGTNVTAGSAGNMAVSPAGLVPGSGNSSANPITFAYASNAITFLYGFGPNASGFVGKDLYFQLMHSLAENASGAQAIGRYTGGRVGYNGNGLNVALSYSKSVGPASPAYAPGTTSTDHKEFNLGASYNFNFGSVMGHIGTNDTNFLRSRFRHWGVGANIRAGTGTIPISFNTVERNDLARSGARQLAVGYVHPLSKRTNLYAHASRLKNKNGATNTFRGGNGGSNPGLAGAGSGTGYAIGIRHSF